VAARNELGANVSADDAAEDRKSGARHQSRWKRWQSKRPSTMAPRAADAEPWAWSIGVSDWPIGKSDYDLPAEQAVRAVLGLDRYYEHAMTTLSVAGTDDDEAGPEAHGDSAADPEAHGEAPSDEAGSP